MEFLDYDKPLSDAQEKAKTELIEALLKNKTIGKFMDRYECPESIIIDNPYTFKIWLEALSRVNGLSKEELEQNPSLGGYIDISYDKDLGVLKEVYRYVSLAQEIKEDSAYLSKYQYFELPKRLQKAFFETIDIKNENPRYKVAVKLLIEFTENDKLGYFLYGDYGVGKSYLAACVTNAFANEGKRCIFVSVADLLLKLKNNFGSFNNQNEDILDAIRRADIVVFDDLGAEPISTWSRDEVLLPLLNARMENERKTLFTSNSPFDMLETMYVADTRGREDLMRSRRCVDRTTAIAEPYEIIGENRRHKTK